MPTEDSYARSDLPKPGMGIGKQDRARPEFDIQLTQYGSMINEIVTLNLRLESVIEKLIGPIPSTPLSTKTSPVETEPGNILARFRSANGMLDALRNELQGHVHRLEELV